MSKKILVVEDEADVKIYLQALFEDNGYEVVTAGDGKIGMELVRSEKPDLITLDISMPEESGVKMYRQLHEEPELKKIPVFIVTGLSSEFKRFMAHMQKRHKVDPPTAYFEKPIDEKMVIKKIKEVIG